MANSLRVYYALGMFEPVNRLEELLQAAFKDPGHRPEFYRLLLDSDLFVIGETGRPGPGEYVAGPEGERISIAAWQRDGRTLIPVFTSESRISTSVDKPTAFIQLNGRALFETLDPRSTVVLNPGCAVGKELAPEELRALLDGSLFGAPEPTHAEPGARVFFGKPGDFPAPLVKALRTLLRKHAEVQAAFLARVGVPESADPPRLLVGLLGDGDTRPAIAEANLVVRNLLEPGEPVDFLDIAGDDLSLRLVGQAHPFYRRSQVH